MKKCDKCNSTIASNCSNCPVCHNLINNLCPPSFSQTKHKVKFNTIEAISKLLFIIGVITTIVLIPVNLVYSNNYLWSFFVSYLIFGLVFFINSIFSRNISLLSKSFTFLVIMVVGILVYNRIFSLSKILITQFIFYTFTLNHLITSIYSVINRKRNKSYLLSAFLIGFTGLFPYFLYLIKKPKIDFFYSILSIIVSSTISFLIFLTFHEDIIKTIKAKLHM